MSLKGALKIMAIARIRSAFLPFAHCLVICAALVCGRMPVFAQTTDSSSQRTQEVQSVSGTPSSDDQASDQQHPSTRSVICGPAHLAQCLKDIGHDQAGIWTSPLRISYRDAFWLVPFAAGTGVALHYDAQAQQNLGIDQSRIDTSNTISQFGSTYATLGAGGTLYVVGRLTHNDHLAETGRLGAEAVIDASLVAEALKLATNRERPDEGNGTGGFWPHGTRNFSDSFPSGHAIGSWALARVIATEYPNKPTQIGVYAFATAISVSRVTARKHFPSDALVGSVLGYLIGGYVVRHHAAQDFKSGFSFVPTVDVSTHTFGGSVDLRLNQLDLAKIGRFVNRTPAHGPCYLLHECP
jgi:membrane-associated phospholipid phosphatase